MNTIRTKTSRAKNAVIADPQRLESPDGRKWATGRTVKGESGPGRWDPVEVWTLKCRDQNGKAVTMKTHCTREAAVAWTLNQS